MERQAAEAERASVKYKQVEFMKDKVGEVFDGVISGVTEWGIYVEVIENRCEGMVRSRDLKGDRFVFDEDNYSFVGVNTNKSYTLGDKVQIVVLEADLTRKQLTYGFADMQGGQNAGDGKSQSRGDRARQKGNRRAGKKDDQSDGHHRKKRRK